MEHATHEECLLSAPPIGPLTTRVAGTDDLEAILALYAEPGLDEDAVIDLEHARAMFANLARYPVYRLYVTHCEGRPVGTFSLLIAETLIHGGNAMGIVDAVVVTGALRGQGIGRHMMEHAYAECRAAGCYKMMLSSATHRIHAHAFYLSLGFTEHGKSFLIDVTGEDA